MDVEAPNRIDIVGIPPVCQWPVLLGTPKRGIPAPGEAVNETVGGRVDRQQSVGGGVEVLGGERTSPVPLYSQQLTHGLGQTETQVSARRRQKSGSWQTRNSVTMPTTSIVTDGSEEEPVQRR